MVALKGRDIVNEEHCEGIRRLNNGFSCNARQNEARKVAFQRFKGLEHRHRLYAAFRRDAVCLDHMLQFCHKARLGMKQ
jgi:hypothetical protein